MTTVRIPAALRDYTSGQSSLEVDAETVAEALDRVSNAHPRLRRHIYTEQGDLRSYVNVFVEENEIRTLNGLDTRLRDGETLMIVPSIAGG